MHIRKQSTTDKLEHILWTKQKRCIFLRNRTLMLHVPCRALPTYPPNKSTTRMYSILKSSCLIKENTECYSGLCAQSECLSFHNNTTTTLKTSKPYSPLYKYLCTHKRKEKERIKLTKLLCCEPSSTTTMFMLLFLFTLLIQTLTVTTTTATTVIGPNTFSFISFSTESCTNGELLCMGSATASNGYLSLTPEPEQDNNSSSSLIGSSSNTANKVGRVLYPHPVHVWSAIISTTFTFRITPFSNDSTTTSSGDGMALVFAQDNRPSPNGSHGSYLGMFDRSTQGNENPSVCLIVHKYHCFKLDDKWFGWGVHVIFLFYYLKTW